MDGRITGNRAPIVLGLAVVVVASASVYVVAQRGATESTAVVNDVVNATIVSASGGRSTARIGSALPVGARIITGSAPGATARLMVGERVIWLGAGTTVTRETQRGFILDRGSIIGGGTGGSPLVIRSDEALISPSVIGAWRVDRGFTTRVASYRGVVHINTDSGGVLDVSPLHQASAAGTALPPTAGPLQLTPGDARERAVVPGIVSLDGYLSRVAAGLDGGNPRGHRVAAAVATTFGLGQSMAAEPVSERVVPAVIAEAVSGTNRSGYTAARALRADGGSWGVVAVLAGANEISPLQQAIASLLDLTETPSPQALTAQTPSSGGRSPTQAAPSGFPGQAPTPASTSPAPQPTHSPSPGQGEVMPQPTATPLLDLGGLIDLLNSLISPSPKPAR